MSDDTSIETTEAIEVVALWEGLRAFRALATERDQLRAMLRHLTR